MVSVVEVKNCSSSSGERSGFPQGLSQNYLSPELSNKSFKFALSISLKGQYHFYHEAANG